jgi:hypothetical protein
VFRLNRRLAILFAVALAFSLPVTAFANHSWGGYHWARTANPFTLKVGDNVNPAWDAYLNTTVGDWTQSTVLNLSKVTGQAKGRCRGTTGRVEVCNGTYGNNGWLGVATIYISGKHITQGTVKVNDTYFNTSTYNAPEWRNLVMCQEVGHTLGLDHQDVNFNNANLGTCMDYTSNPGTNQHPNAGDYDELLCIYDVASAGRTLTTQTHSCTGTGHLDSTTTIGAAPVTGADAAGSSSEFGREVARSAGGHTSVFVRETGSNSSVVSFVIWAD